MAIRFPCSQCNRLLTADDPRAGTRVSCPACGRELIVPVRGPAEAPTGPAVPSPPLAMAAGGGVEPLALRTKLVQDDEMDMTPMVDCVFQLLIFFMVTASFALQKSIELPAPDRKESAEQARTLEEIEKDDDYVIVRIDKDNTVFVDDREAPSEQELLVKLREARQGNRASRGGGSSSVMVLADRECRHEIVVRALDAANTVGMENVRLATVDEQDF